MKTKFFYWLGCLFLALAFVSCSSDDDEVGSSDSLVGSWKPVDQQGWEKENGEIVDEWSGTDSVDENSIFTFYENGTGVLSITYEDFDYTYNVNFTWKKSSNKLTCTVNGESTTSTIKTLNSTTLIIEVNDKYTEDGVTYEEYSISTYRRLN